MRELAVGIDLMPVDEVTVALARFGDRYLHRIFTVQELDCARGDPAVQASRLAACFAAKEATIKALAPDDYPPEWRSIEVRQAGGGHCTLHLSGRAAELARRSRITEFAVSLTQQGNLAAAVVIALGEIDS